MQAQEIEKIKQSIQAAIKGNNLLMEDDILVKVDEGELLLSGVVEVHDKKWLAEDLANSLSSSLHVRNEIEVIEEDEAWPEMTRRTIEERRLGLDAGLT